MSEAHRASTRSATAAASGEAPARGVQRPRGAGEVIRIAAKRFVQIDGMDWAGSFAFSAFCSLFPTIILFVTIASFFVDREGAERAIVAWVEGYVPLDGDMRTQIFGSIAGVIQAREQAGVVALVILIWTSIQCFTTLVRVTNHAWGDEAFNWWRMPLRGMALLAVTAGALLLGMAGPALAGAAKSWLFPANQFSSFLYELWVFMVPILVLFLSLTVFYRVAPRRKTRFAEVWVPAALTTALLQIAASLFVVYLERFATLSAVYGVFGGIIALLLWVQVSGGSFIFGACLCAAQADRRRPSP